MLLIPQEPYKPWEIQEKNFPKNKSIEEQCKFLVRYGILAPSSHNTQPWKFRVKGNIIKIYPEYKYALDYSDRANRELYMSLGCVAANILVAASHFELGTKITYLPEDDVEDVAIKIELNQNVPVDQTNKTLFSSITKRMSNRLPPLKQEIDSKILHKLTSFNEGNQFNLRIITDKEQKKKISKIMKEAIHYAFTDKLFKLELSHWVTSVYTRRKDGITLFDFEIPYPLTLLAPIGIRNMPAIIQEEMDEKFVADSPGLLIILASDNEKETWLKVGETFEYYALGCASHKIAVAPMAGIIEHEDSNMKLKSLLKTNLTPLFFARFGYMDKESHHSPRRPLEEVLLQ